MFRFILVAIFLIFYFIFYLPALFVTWLIGKINKNAGDRASLWVVTRLGFKPIQYIAGIRLEVIGLEKIPDTAVLYIGNHRSFFDTVLSYPLVKNPTGYVAKKEILKVPILNLWMLMLHCQFLDRKNPRSGMDMLLKSIDLVKEGISVCIFPEGTRKKDPASTEIQPFHAGSFKVATKSGCPIVPMTIVYGDKVWEDHFPFMKSTHVVIEYGDPIYTKELSKDEQKNIADTVHDIIQSTYTNNLEKYADFLSKKSKHI